MCLENAFLKLLFNEASPTNARYAYNSLTPSYLTITSYTTTPIARTTTSNPHQTPCSKTDTQNLLRHPTSSLLPTPLKHPPILLQTRDLPPRTTLQRTLDLLLYSSGIPMRILLAIQLDDLVFLLYPIVSIKYPSHAPYNAMQNIPISSSVSRICARCLYMLLGALILYCSFSSRSTSSSSMVCGNRVAVSGRTTDGAAGRRVEAWKRARRDGGGRVARLEGSIAKSLWDCGVDCAGCLG
jgi:hypothetical protein